MSQINKSAAQLLAPIVSNKKVGQYHQIIINIGDLANLCKPGNFVAINVGGDSSSMILRRAFAISRVSVNSIFGGTMEIIAAPHGQGRRAHCVRLLFLPRGGGALEWPRSQPCGMEAIPTWRAPGHAARDRARSGWWLRHQQFGLSEKSWIYPCFVMKNVISDAKV